VGIAERREDTTGEMTMPGPTEVLTDDVKGLRDDLHKVELDVREVSTQVRGLLTAIKLLAVLAVSTLGASIWWGATLTADMRHLSSKIDERSSAIDSRIDKLEAAIVKALDQAKAKPATNPRAN
jgi:hypothetical protein